MLHPNYTERQEQARPNCQDARNDNNKNKKKQPTKQANKQKQTKKKVKQTNKQKRIIVAY